MLLKSPAAVMLSSSTSLGSKFFVTIGNPTQLGASSVHQTGATTATLTLYPISTGQTGTGRTIVSVKSPSGDVARIDVRQASCANSASPLGGAQLIFPRSRQSGVSRSVGMLYFRVFEHSDVPKPAPKLSKTLLHLIVNSKQTLEGGQLSEATPPPGSLKATPSPIPGPWAFRYMQASVPALPRASKITTQVYNANCKPATATDEFQTE
jgi:hypothetical protein